MTSATLPVFAQNVPVQNGRFGGAAATDGNGASGQSFSRVMESVTQRVAPANRQVAGNELPVALEAGKDIPVQNDAVMLSMIQQMLLNLPIANQMTQEQLQTLAKDIFDSLPQMQIQKGVIPDGLFVENVAKYLQDLKKESESQHFRQTLGQALSETVHALQPPQDNQTEVPTPETASVKSPDVPSKVSSEPSAQDFADLIPSTVKEIEIPDAEEPSVKQLSPFPLQAGAHQIANIQGRGELNTDMSVTTIRDIHEPIRAAAEAGTRQMVMRLDPPGLGDVQIRLRMQQGVLTAELKVDSGGTKDLFTSALPQIRQQLESSGIQVGEIHVDLHDDYLAGQGQKRDQEQGRQNRQTNQQGENFFEYLA